MALVLSGIGWFRCQRWGWRLAVGIIATQVEGDIINLVRGDWLRGGIGVVVAGDYWFLSLDATSQSHTPPSPNPEVENLMVLKTLYVERNGILKVRISTAFGQRSATKRALR